MPTRCNPVPGTATHRTCQLAPFSGAEVSTVADTYSAAAAATSFIPAAKASASTFARAASASPAGAANKVSKETNSMELPVQRSLIHRT